MLASALVTLPVVLSMDGSAGLVNAATIGPLGDLRPAPGTPDVPQTDLGATGATPHDTQLSQQLAHDADNPAALTTGAGSQANLPKGPLGIPGVVLDAYTHAQQVLGVEDPSCHLPWWLLAGIGKIESGQAENGEVDSNGTTLRPILGPELNGAHGFAAIPSSDGGKWTGDSRWERAVGPMQFLPSTWLEYGGGGNPNNVYDSAIAAGRYLCNGDRDLSDPSQQAAAVFSYNHSDSYVRIVLIWAHAYEGGVTPVPGTRLPLGPFPDNTPHGPGTTPTHPGGGGSTTTTTTSTSAPTSGTSSTTTTGAPPTTTTTTTTTSSGSTTTTTTGGTTTTTPTTTTSTCPPPTTTTDPAAPTETTTPTPPPPGCDTTTTTPPTTTSDTPAS